MLSITQILNNQSKLSKKNINIYKQNIASNVVVGQYSTNTSAQNLNYAERSMSPMINSQKIPAKSKITSYENMSIKNKKIVLNNKDQQILIKKFKDTNNSSNGTMNKSTISAQNKFHSLNTLKDYGINMSNKAMTLQLDQDNIEDMHLVMVAFHRSIRNLLGKVENKQNK